MGALGRRALICCLLVCWTVSALEDGNGDCQNPMFAEPLRAVNNERLKLLPTPQMTQGLDVCTNMNGKESCCSTDTFTDVKAFLSRTDEQIKMVQNLAEQMNEQTFERMISMSGSFPPEVRPKLVAVFRAAKKMLRPTVNCLGGMIGYMQGVLCLSCEPNYRQFYDVISGNFSVSTGTCSSVYDACTGVFDGLNELLPVVLDLYIALFQSSSSVDPQVLAGLQRARAMLGDHPNVCAMLQGMGKSCQSQVCDNLNGLDMFDGLNGSLPFNPLHPIGPHFQTDSVSSTSVSRLSKLVRSHSSSSPSSSLLAPHFLSALSALSSSASPMHLMHALRPYAEHVHTLLASDATTNHSRPMTRNVYTHEGGYEAYALGCSSAKMSSYACIHLASPGKSGLSAGVIVGIVIGVLAVCAVLIYLGVVYWRRKQAQNHTENGSQLRAYTPPTYDPLT